MKSVIPTPLPRIVAFERLGYGLFIHWGVYSQHGRGEWVQDAGKTPTNKYAELGTAFTAHDFDAPSIARLARYSGMKYAVLTTRHHDGFSLYDTSGFNQFDAPNNPAGRDLIAEFVTACSSEGILPFFYQATLDFRGKSGMRDPATSETYLDYLDLHTSVEILCSQYGKIGGLWFDGNWSRSADWKADRLYATICKYQPEAMIIDNTGIHELGKTGHPNLDRVIFEPDLPDTSHDRWVWSKYLAGEMFGALKIAAGDRDLL